MCNPLVAYAVEEVIVVFGFKYISVDFTILLEACHLNCFQKAADGQNKQHKQSKDMPLRCLIKYVLLSSIDLA